MRRALLTCLILAACGPDLPPVEGAISAAARSRPGPELVPLDPLLAEGARPSRAAVAGADLQDRRTRLSRSTIAPPAIGDLEARGAALRRAAADAPPAPGSNDLAARGRRLRDRADALRRAPL